MPPQAAGHVEVRSVEIYDDWRGKQKLPPLPANAQAWDMAGSTLVLGDDASQRPAGGAREPVAKGKGGAQ